MTLQNQILVRLDDPEPTICLHLLSALVQQQRLHERVAESDIHQPTPIERDHQRHVIELRTKLTLRVTNSGSQHRDIKPKRAQQPRKQTIHFVTKPAAPPLDDL